jgi:hypothetical protein
VEFSGGPTRPPTKAFEDNSALEFDFYLAEQLHMTVGEMRTRMANDEWVRWSVYYARKAQRQELARLRREG